MTQAYGFPLETWEEAADEARQILIRCARNEQTITYSELVLEMETITLEPDSYALASMLGEISSSEHTAGRGMLSVLVVHKYGDQKPGSGFFNLARDLGEQVNDEDEFWVEEFRRVIDSWQSDRE